MRCDVIWKWRDVVLVWYGCGVGDGNVMWCDLNANVAWNDVIDVGVMWCNRVWCAWYRRHMVWFGCEVMLRDMGVACLIRLWCAWCRCDMVWFQCGVIRKWWRNIGYMGVIVCDVHDMDVKWCNVNRKWCDVMLIWYVCNMVRCARWGRYPSYRPTISLHITHITGMTHSSQPHYIQSLWYYHIHIVNYRTYITKISRITPSRHINFIWHSTIWRPYHTHIISHHFDSPKHLSCGSSRLLER